MATATSEQSALEAQPRTPGTKNDARRVRQQGKVRFLGMSGIEPNLADRAGNDQSAIADEGDAEKRDALPRIGQGREHREVPRDVGARDEPGQAGVGGLRVPRPVAAAATQSSAISTPR